MAGILIFGLNGCGKSTLGRRLSEITNIKYMDIEDYTFEPSDEPYARPRPKDKRDELLLSDMRKFGSFILSSVKGDFCAEITSAFTLGARLSVPRDVRIERVRARDEAGVTEWANEQTFPIIELSGLKSIEENAAHIADYLAHGA